MSSAPWSPPTGRLFVTTYTDPGHEQACRLNCIDHATWKPPMHLCYRLTDEPRFSCAVIMQGSQERAAWRTGPAEYVAFDTEPARYVSETGIVVERRLATDDDLRAMFAAWKIHGFTLEQWLMSVRLTRWLRTDYAPIAVDELQRMARVIDEVERQPAQTTAEERDAFCLDAARSTIEQVRAMVGARYDEATTDAVARALRGEGGADGDVAIVIRVPLDAAWASREELAEMTDDEVIGLFLEDTSGALNPSRMRVERGGKGSEG